MNRTETTAPTETSLHPIDWILFPGCQEDADAQAAYCTRRGFDWAKLDADYGMPAIFRSLSRMAWDLDDDAVGAIRRAAERYTSRR